MSSLKEFNEAEESAIKRRLARRAKDETRRKKGFCNVHESYYSAELFPEITDSSFSLFPLDGTNEKGEDVDSVEDRLSLTYASVQPTRSQKRRLRSLRNLSSRWNAR